MHFALMEWEDYQQDTEHSRDQGQDTVRLH